MSAAPEKPAEDHGEAPKGKGKKKLVLIAVPVLLIAVGAGLWFTGILPGLLGMGPAAPVEVASGEGRPEAPPPPPAFLDVPEIITNLNAPGRRPTFVKLRSKVEVGRGDEVDAVRAAMPRLIDLFQTYLREMRPEELRGSAGTHRLREELMARANIATAPARITDILFVEIIVQ